MIREFLHIFKRIISNPGRVVEGMECAGITNAKMKFHWPANGCCEDVRIVHMPRLKQD
jgi:hypothetical protein